MSVKISGVVWELDLDPTEKLILLALADHADHDGNNIYPGNPLLVAKTGLSQPTITAKMKKFVTEGVLEPQTSQTPGRGNKRGYSLDISSIPRRKYFIDNDAQKDGGKVKAASSFQKAKTDSSFPEKVKADTDEKVKADAEKVKTDSEKVKADTCAYKEEPSENRHVEPSKGEPVTPFESFEPVPDSDQEKTLEEIRQALIKLFRGALSPHSDRLGQLALMVYESKAPAAYIAAWPNWFRTRYKGRPANHLQFGDTFTELAEEGLEPDAWLNGSGGARLVAGVCGYLTKPGEPAKPVSAAVAHEIVGIGHWLDAQTGLHSRDEWINAGITPLVFKKFWKERGFTTNGKPQPQSVLRHWRDFYESLPGKGGK